MAIIKKTILSPSGFVRGDFDDLDAILLEYIGEFSPKDKVLIKPESQYIPILCFGATGIEKIVALDRKNKYVEASMDDGCISLAKLGKKINLGAKVNIMFGWMGDFTIRWGTANGICNPAGESAEYGKLTGNGSLTLKVVDDTFYTRYIAKKIATVEVNELKTTWNSVLTEIAESSMMDILYKFGEFKKEIISMNSRDVASKIQNKFQDWLIHEYHILGRDTIPSIEVTESICRLLLCDKSGKIIHN